MSWRALRGFRSAQFAVPSRAEAAVPCNIDFASWRTREFGIRVLLAVASVAAVSVYLPARKATTIAPMRRSGSETV
jgi:hypothetical protein